MLMRFDVQFSQTDQRFAVSFDGNKKTFDAGFKDIQTVSVTPEAYEGEYAVTPQSEKQTMPTRGKYMVDDIIVNPIPERYGLITYDHNKIITVT